ncbi:MAG TPA: sugar transferase, partial [Hyphomicrobium sp.]
ANMTAFDLPVHEGGQVTTTHEPTHTHERPKNPKERVFRKQQTAKLGSLIAASAASNGSRAAEPALSVLISAASAVDGPAPDGGVFWVRGDASPEPIGGLLKRVLDIVVAGAALVALSPLLLAVTVLIYLTMGRPILFPQRRLGFDGLPFACLKFRTMVNDSEMALRSHLANNPEAAREWNDKQKLQNDPRVTALGHILRRSSIDELPQFFSVLAGHMSCVGPRPIIAEEMGRYGRYWNDYVKARPGLTGAWQVSGRNRISYRKRVALDTHYVRRWSVWRDLGILLKTIPAVLKTDDTA